MAKPRQALFLQLLLGVALLAGLLLTGSWLLRDEEVKPIRVGVLHSLSGTMSISERPVGAATLMAIEEINAAGGVNGRPIEPILVDAKSDPVVFGREAARLIDVNNVSAIFGCWTSASRKQVKTVVEDRNHLLVYPVQYEGLEESPNIIYLGAAPSQQIIPAVKWCFDNLGKKAFLVGSDYVFPRTANEIIHDVLNSLGGEIVGEEYLLLGSSEVEPVVDAIIEAEPDVILNTLNGDSNLAFYEVLRKRGISPRQIPSMSFSIAEPELLQLGPAQMAGDYAAWSYFETVQTRANTQFVENFRIFQSKLFPSLTKALPPPADRVLSDPMEAAYVGVKMWAGAVEDAQSDAPEDVLETIVNQSYPAPEGIVCIDMINQHAWKHARIGRIDSAGQFDIIWQTDRPVQPIPFPIFRPRSEWEQFLTELRQKWGGWQNPGRE